MIDAVEFKPSQLSLTLVRIHQPDVAAVKENLTQKLAKAGKFLRGAPVVVDPNCDLKSMQLAQIVELLRQHEMTPVGVRTADPVLVEYAEMSGLAVFKPAAPQAASAAPEAKSSTTVSKPSPAVAGLAEKQSLQTAKIIATGLRSGQTEQHMLGDLMVRGSVNSGAEVYAGGHLTIFGSVRGRLHAGATGNVSARIVAHDFNPELVSIAGIFLLSDDIPRLAKQGWVEVYLDDQTLKFNSLD
jgi:septum site-determining protein MinC